MSDYVAASCESGQRCHRLNNLASTNSLHTHVTRVVSSCPVWKSSQIHEFVQLCQKQIETGRVHEQLQSEAPFLKIYFFYRHLPIIPNTCLVGRFTDNHGIAAFRQISPTPIIILPFLLLELTMIL